MGRSFRRSSVTALLLAVIGIAVSGTRVSAHRRDEFLHAARIGLEPGRVHVELNLVPGIAVADAVIREIDANGDDAFSAVEQQRYVRRVLDGLLLRVDEARVIRLAPLRSTFPTAVALRTGAAAINLRLAADLPGLSVGAHRLLFRNENAKTGGVFLANTLMPENDDVVVTAQQRDVEQRELLVEFSVRNAPPQLTYGWMWPATAMALGILTPLVRRSWHARP